MWNSYVTISTICFLDTTIIGNVFSLGINSIQIQVNWGCRVISVLFNYAPCFVEKLEKCVNFPPIFQIAYTKYKSFFYRFREFSSSRSCAYKWIVASWKLIIRNKIWAKFSQTYAQFFPTIYFQSQLTCTWSSP